MTQYKFTYIHFDDMLTDLWERAYSEIINIASNFHLYEQDIVVCSENLNLYSIKITSDDCISFITYSGECITAEECEDAYIYEAYELLYKYINK